MEGPWVTLVAKTAKADEKTIKFDWSDPANSNQSFGPLPSCRNAAAVLGIGGPYMDGYDNDGDQAIDDYLASSNATAKDAGTFAAGRFGGPELRVAGHINPNTATTETLRALEKGLGLMQNTLVNAITNKRKAGIPIKSVADLQGLINIDTGDSRSGCHRGKQHSRQGRRRLQRHLHHLHDAKRHVLDLRNGPVHRSAGDGAGDVDGGPQAGRQEDAAVLVPGGSVAVAGVSAVRPRRRRNDNFTRPRILNIQWMD